MDYLSKRLKTILFKLANTEDGVITSQALANLVSVSQRTIKNDMAELGCVLKDYGAKIESKMGRGYSLTVVDSFLFNQYLSTLKAQETNPVQEIPKYRYERINYIIKKLLAIDYYVRLEYLEDELFVSRSTITADLKEAREVLQEYNLQIVSKPNYGIILEGDEINIRLCISEYYFHSNISTGFFAADHAMFVSNSNQSEISFINKMLIDIISEYKLNISDFALQNLVIHIVIAIRRWRFYNYAKISKERIDKIKVYREFAAGNRIKEELEKWLNVILPIDESIYFTLHLHSKHVNELEELSRETILLVEQTLFDIYRMLQREFNFIAIDKTQYEEYVRLHIPVMVERLRTGMVIRNPQAYKTMGKYPLAAHITLFISRIIEENFKVQMNVNEFAYLVLYTNLLILNSTKKRMKILLACCQGRPEMITLLNELDESILNKDKTIEICDFYKLDTKNLDDYALLITTVPLNTPLHIPTVYVSDSQPYYMQIQKAMQDISLRSANIHEALQNRYFLNRMKANDRDEVLRKIAQCFPDASQVYKELWKAEQEQSGETAANAVILHSYQRLAEDFIFITVLKRPIIWKKQWMQVVFWVNSAEPDIVKLTSYYRFITHLLKIDNVAQKLLGMRNIDEICGLTGDTIQQGEDYEVSDSGAW